jgi:dethiobiotin synthetase
MPSQPGLAEQEAPHLLASLASADLLGVLPEVAGPVESRVEQLADALATLPTLAWLIRAIGVPEH